MSLRPSALLVIPLALLAGCQGGAAVERPEAAARSLRVECAAGCRVDLFDGSGLQRLPVPAGGEVTLPPEGPLVVFVSAPGQVPQVKHLAMGSRAGAVRLQPIPDSRTGYLAVAVVNVISAGKRPGGGLRLEPAAGTELSVVAGRARALVTTDHDGVSVTPQVATRYSVLVDGQRHDVDVPQNDSVVLPVVLKRVMAD